MTSHRTTFFVRIASTCVVVAGLTWADSSAAVRVQKRGGRLRVASPVATAEVRLARFALQVRDRRGKRLTGEPKTGGIFFERAGTSVPIKLCGNTFRCY
jgi:hypothetical protein